MGSAAKSRGAKTPAVRETKPRSRKPFHAVLAGAAQQKSECSQRLVLPTDSREHRIGEACRFIAAAVRDGVCVIKANFAARIPIVHIQYAPQLNKFLDAKGVEVGRQQNGNVVIHKFHSTVCQGQVSVEWWVF